MMTLAALLGLYFSLKLGIVAASAARLHLKIHSWSLSAALSWIALQLGLTAWALVLSPFHAFTESAVWIILVAAFAVLVIGRPVHDLPRLRLSSMAVLAGLGALTIFGGLFYRSLCFYDTSWDALTYEMPRIAFYIHARSILVHFPTQQINIFANEWNGEMVSFFSAMACGTDQAAGFGGAEIWLWAWIAVVAIFRRWRVPTAAACGYALFLTSTPALLGLAFTVKGDLLAAVGIMLGIACLSVAPGEDGELVVLAAVTALTFAGGAKITALPLAGLLSAMAMTRLAWSRRRMVVPGLICILGLLSLSRYVANFFAYGHPFKRAAAEAMAPKVANIISNLRGMPTKYWGTALWARAGAERGALGFDFGLAGWFMLAVFLLACLFSRGRFFIRLCSLRFLALLLVFLTGYLYVACHVPWLPWSFRYYLPWVLAITSAIYAYGSAYLPPLAQRILLIAILPASAWHFIYTFEPGEELPTSFLVAQSRSQLERKLALHSYIYSDDLKYMASVPSKKIIIFNQINSCIFPFFGDENQNRIRLVDSPNRLMAEAEGKSADFLVLSGPRPPNYEAVAGRIKGAGYRLMVENEFFAIFASQRIPRT